MAGLLSQCRVLDISDSRGAACSTFLASLGAEVIRVEQGDSSDDLIDIMNRRGKQSITLNIENDDGVTLFKQLIAKCDFLLETFTPSFLKSRQLGFEKLSAINPELIHISITPFGQTGPYSDFVGGELVASAMGGTLATCGYPDDTPVLEALDACSFHANSAAAMAAMFAHLERCVSKRGQHIDCAIQEVAASRNTNNLLCWQFDQRTLPRAGDRVQFGAATVRVIWELADGYCFHSLMTGKFGAPANSALSQWMSDEGFDNPMCEIDWDKYDRSALPAATRLTWEAAIDAFFKTKTKQDVRTEGYRRGIRATVANTPDDVLADQHLVARDFLQATTYPDGQELMHPDYFVRLTNNDYRIGHVVPPLGRDNDRIYGELLGLSETALAKYKQSGAI